MSKTVDEWATELGKAPRTIRRWLAAGRVDGAVHANNQWIIPDDATPPDDQRPAAAARRRAANEQVAELARAQGMTHYQTPGLAVQGVPASAARYEQGIAPHKFWFTVDELEQMWAPYLTRHAIIGMLREGELVGYRRGRNGSWVIPRSELTRIGGKG